MPIHQINQSLEWDLKGVLASSKFLHPFDTYNMTWELMSILVNGWPIVLTLLNLVGRLDTTMVLTHKRGVACLQNI